MTRSTPVLVALVLFAAAAGVGRAQESPAFRRLILVEARVGTTEMLGNPGRTLIGADDAIGVGGAVQLSPKLAAWLNADFRPSNSSRLYPGPGLSPAVSMLALTVGVSRAFGPPIGRAQWRPIDVGLGAGATRTMVEWRGYNDVTEPPPGAQLEDPRAAGLLSSARWRPTAAARLRLAVPVGRVARLSATAALLATHVGDVRLWNGQWEPTGDGSRYRASSQTWRYGTAVSVPFTLGLGVAF
jgi:hypothetical protein